MYNVLMISSAAGESGIGDYVEDLTGCFSEVRVGNVFLPMNSNNPLSFTKAAIHPLMENSDVIHIQHEYGQFGTISLMSLIFFPILYLVAEFRGIPVVVTMHEGLNEQLVTRPLKYFKQRYINLLNTVVTIGADRVIFLSEQTAEEIQQGVTADSSVVLYHGVSTEGRLNISKSEAKNRLGYNSDCILISEPGYIEPRKGSDRFVKLAERLPEYEFVLGGGASSQSYRGYVDRIKRHAPTNLTVTGKLDKERFHTLFLASDLVILPYNEVNQGGIVNTTNQSGILNRCATYSKPVLTSSQSYFKTVERDWNALITCDFDDLDRVEGKVRKLISDPQKRKELSEAIDVFAEKHSFDHIAEQHEKIYEELSHR